MTHTEVLLLVLEALQKDKSYARMLMMSQEDFDTTIAAIKEAAHGIKENT